MAEGQLPESSRYLGTVFCIGVVATLAIAASPLIVDGLVTHAHFSLAEAGACVSIETVGQVVGTTAALMMVQTFSPRRLIASGLALMILGNLATSQVYGFSEFAAFRVLAGIGCGLVMLFQLLLAQTKRPQRNFAIYTGLNVLGSAGLSFGMPWLLSVGGVGAAYGSIGALCTACLVNASIIPGRVTGPPDSAKPNLVHSSRQREQGLWAAIFKTEYQVVCLVVGVYSSAIAAIWTYLGVYGLSHSMSDDQVATAVSVAWLVGGALGALACAWSEGQVDLKLSLVLQLLALTGVVALLAVTASPTSFWLSTAIFVFLWMLSYACFMSFLSHVDRTGTLATASSLVQIIAFVVGPAIGAWLMHLGHPHWLLIVVAAGFLRSAAVLYFGRPLLPLDDATCRMSGAPGG